MADLFVNVNPLGPQTASGIAIGANIVNGTTGSVLFVDGSGLLGKDAQFNWDNTNKRLSLGSLPNAGASTFCIDGNSPNGAALYIQRGGMSIIQGSATALTTVINSSVTWTNAAVTFTGWKLNVTDTSSTSTSLLMDLQVGSSTKFNVDKTGIPTSAASRLNVSSDGLSCIKEASGLILDSGASSRDVMFQIQGTTKGKISKTAGDGFTITAGTAITAVNALNITQTWNEASTIFTGISYVLTDTASNSNSRLIDLNAKMYCYKNGNLAITDAMDVMPSTAIPAGGSQGKGYRFYSTANFGVFGGSGAPTLSAAKGSLYLRSDGTTTNNRAYINTDGSTTWTALTTAA